GAVVVWRVGPRGGPRDTGPGGRGRGARRACRAARRRVPHRRRAGPPVRVADRGPHVSEIRTHGSEHDWDIEDAHPTKGTPLMLLALILSSVALAAAAQILLNHGMNQFQHRTRHAFRLDGASARPALRTPG